MSTERPPLPWITTSDPGQQRVVCGAGVVVGALILGGGWQLGGFASQTTGATSVLGGLILLIALVGIVLDERQTVILDLAAKVIIVERVSRLGTQRRRITLAEVEDVTLGELGDQEGGSVSYHVELVLRRGERVALFVGAFDGAYDRAVMDGRRRRIVEGVRATRLTAPAGADRLE
jgi:hypothetical protein